LVTTRKGITVEIDNIDAEGQLVLFDALAETENDEPELLIDFATLTGVMRVASGQQNLLSNYFISFLHPFFVLVFVGIGA